jgi:hypothetical protein
MTIFFIDELVLHGEWLSVVYLKFPLPGFFAPLGAIGL